MTAPKILDILLAPIKKNLSLFSFIFVSQLILAGTLYNLSGLSRYWCVKYALYSCVDVYLFCALALWGGKYIKTLLYGIIGLLFLTETFLILNFQALINSTTLTMLLQTDNRESKEFISMCIAKPETWWSLLLFVCTTLFSAKMVPFVIRKLTNRYSELLAKIQKRTIPCILFIAFCLVFCFWKQVKYYNVPIQYFYGAFFDKEVHPKVQGSVPTCWQHTLLAASLVARNSTATKGVVKATREATVDSCAFTSPTIVLIIGESFNKHHTPLYNQQSLPTTPNLCRRTEQGSIIPCSDVVSPYNSTSRIIAQLFSMSNCDNLDAWGSAPLFPALFKKSGYEVDFISNQFIKNEMNANTWDAVGGSIFNQPDLDSLQFDYRNAQKYPFDIELTKEYQDLQKTQGKPQLVIFHLIGQHTAYEARHPEDYTPIAKEAIKLEYNSSEDALAKAWHYENATHYNDYVVDSILKLFDKTEAIGIYLSDHGEEMYDFRDFFHRSQEEPNYYNIAKYEYEVPFMFYASEKYQSAHPEIMEQIRKAKEKPFMTDDLPQILLYLAGIKQKYYDEERNLLSPNYNTHRKRLLKGTIDYDLLRQKESTSL